ncbi:alkaline phosphatase [Vibrio nigripulchritudo]|uniref:alkaline phosphatase n=1 Tax=Vibrio nigripulchritudo TaxID=28173 RepID=UPI0024912834|nr:alkaline phosphatase [Vibrio nigripulchritudo]BDU38809.1 alkaline phosphatase [Vibrio nigripulchritudo]BDU44529.1 alkaline phosphatase [Vibrio nigripulchritudo]
MKGLQISLLAASLIAAGTTYANVPQQSDSWYKDAKSAIAAAKERKPIDGPAKNVILFVGDGMSVGTITAARIYAGQQQGEKGEEYVLAMERLPHTALSKTYNTDMQTPDSAGTATAMVSGVKTKAGIINVNDNVQRGFCNTQKGNEVKTAFQMAAEKGLSLGVVSTARLTHATPATTYAHSADRNWENDGKLTNIAKDTGCTDIAHQFVNFGYGDGFQVAFGGGRREFIPNTMTDPEGKKGKRKDGRNLVDEWQQRYPEGNYVYDRTGFDKLSGNTQRAFGLFESSHMQYEADRVKENKEPSLAEMTSKAIEILKNNDKGYLLMVESGRIDHAHHAGNAARALEDTVEYDRAIKAALEMTDPKDTLIIVTADHAHTLISNGYAERGNPILGLSRSKGKLNKDEFGKNYTTLAYGNGPGAVEGGRTDLTEKDVQKLGYLQQALVKLSSETHSGEDVAIFARGPQAWLFQGVVEQNYIYHVIDEALKLTK